MKLEEYNVLENQVNSVFDWVVSKRVCKINNIGGVVHSDEEDLKKLNTIFPKEKYIKNLLVTAHQDHVILRASFYEK
jgi:hypothetical protein